MTAAPSAARPLPPGESDPPRRPSVLLVSSRRLVATALASLLELPPLHAATVVAHDAEEAAGQLATRSYDALVIDAAGYREGPDLLLELNRLAPGLPALVIVDGSGQTTMTSVLDSGAAGVLTKWAEPEELTSAMVAILGGHVVLDHRIARGPDRDGGGPAAGPQLSASELDILAMLGRAWTTEAIAQARGTGLKTVRNHIASIYRKLNIRSRTQAVRQAAQMGLIEDLSLN